MAADVEISHAQVISPEVAERDQELRSRLAESAELYARAVLAEDWRVLGFGSVEEWSADVLGSARLAVEARQRIAEQLSAAGKTVREIAAATGTAKSTTARDLSQSGTTASDLATRNEPVTRQPRPKSPAQRVREHRERKREEGAHLAPGGAQPAIGSVAQPVSTDPVPRIITKSPKLLSDWEDVNLQFAQRAEGKVREELTALREQVQRRDNTSAELVKEIKRLEKENTALAKENTALKARVRQLEAEQEPQPLEETAQECSHQFPHPYDEEAGEHRCAGPGCGAVMDSPFVSLRGRS